MLNARMQTYLETEKKVLASGIVLKYLPDEYLFRKGQKAEFVFYVQSGGLLFEWPNEKKIITITQVPFFIGIDEMLLNEFDDALPYFLQKEAEFIQLKKENKPDLYSV
jgi:CRP-like cAMP-binding protein